MGVKRDVIAGGDENGNEMVVRFRMPSGLEIIGLPTRNFYGGHWDLGPTWNYLVLADRPFLVDAGRFGQGGNLIGMIKAAGINPSDLAFVLISHGHEDHDGGLAELVKFTRMKVKAHAVYELLIRRYPRLAPAGPKSNFPAKCWHCFMPESFYRENCTSYHRVLHDLAVDTLGKGVEELMPGVRAFHLPGHSPDCLALLLGEEALIAGDIILPDISPWPTREEMFDEVARVLGPAYTYPSALFGLARYIKSLSRLRALARQNDHMALFPGHRIYYGGRWNHVDPVLRVDELIRHHVERCGAILHILKHGPKTADEIALEHFNHDLLEGFGRIMAANEVVSHCELLIRSGDIVPADGKMYMEAGAGNFEAFIESLQTLASEEKM
ncbi:MAG: MBL fold metallo-hydrolase [Deltaproteobacteria bacterium]|nr:MBL fold metallo-hydrolase [Deltaproteobacteria bacterium]